MLIWIMNCVSLGPKIQVLNAQSIRASFGYFAKCVLDLYTYIVAWQINTDLPEKKKRIKAQLCISSET
jgi:hypothetical protein